MKEIKITAHIPCGGCDKESLVEVDRREFAHCVNVGITEIEPLLLGTPLGWINIQGKFCCSPACAEIMKKRDIDEAMEDARRRVLRVYDRAKVGTGT